VLVLSTAVLVLVLEVLRGKRLVHEQEQVQVQVHQHEHEHEHEKNRKRETGNTPAISRLGVPVV
jgi:cell division protein FtsB